jgi:hypothetical protein
MRCSFVRNFAGFSGVWSEPQQLTNSRRPKLFSSILRSFSVARRLYSANACDQPFVHVCLGPADTPDGEADRAGELALGRESSDRGRAQARLGCNASDPENPDGSDLHAMHPVNAANRLAAIVITFVIAAGIAVAQDARRRTDLRG